MSPMALAAGLPELKREENTDFLAGLRRSGLGWTTGGAW